ncbi:ABC transporter permease [Acidomonas methanolica]|uniref:ABC transporter polysaccharide/O-antigene exporter n=1 Tax=Acidomonas methanolica NBRC 104435 TaxID=1231351 RepID=A0A023D520_ACIMT|nr:ABC transporter permease [Acidomonas methanolica]MBU2654865.1 ABC transporter permease [Acidomonas methanolica]TCS24768.1 lipopolysaccharide transport system permease protein [Acidomonas methanolica]GAJ29159.1 ABC transporter polysaccharide/O-antigene exporter [Acidomonas methanolica NBRC 104435]GBQ60439.1 polysaccharide/O-antigen exporter permease [Acidomonas methanolica]GEK99846.1 sugar ABC transporter permease [Acidomonas methanolica NBRC 104435]
MNVAVLPDPSVVPVRRTAWADLREAARLWRLAVTLGWLDVKLRYRGSLLGPFWLTLSSLLMLGSMGLIYARLFHVTLREYLPFLALSLALWQTGLAALLQESCTCFIDVEGSIRSVRLPYGLQALRVLVRNAIVFAHNIVVPLGVFIAFGLWPGAVALLALPGLALWAVDGLASCLLLGSLCARYRDLPPIVSALTQIAFYVTPIIWRPEQLGSHARLLVFNPFFDLLEVVRAPLLGHAPALRDVAVAVGVSGVFCGVAVLVFARVRSKLAFWV